MPHQGWTINGGVLMAGTALPPGTENLEVVMEQKDGPAVEPELSHIVELDRLPAKGLQLVLEADVQVREKLAGRFGVLSVDYLKADVFVKALAGGPIHRVEGRIAADIVQACVVTLDPVKQHIEEEFSIEFGPEASVEHDLELTLEDPDPVEPIEGNSIDVGEVVSQQVALAIDPYPRAPGADLSQVHAETVGGKGARFSVDEKPNPFAKLAEWKKKE